MVCIRAVAIAVALSAMLAGCQQRTVTNPATPAYWDQGLAAYDRGDYATALDKWRMVGMQGYAVVQYNLGLMFDAGQGVTQNHDQAVIWYRKAARQGHAGAQNNLGYMYGTGRGVTRDYVRAVKWYRLAAAQGNAMAQTNLGVMYDEGYGVTQDGVQARMWFHLATAQGYEPAAAFGTRIAGRMTSTRSAEARRLAQEWLAAAQSRR